MASDAIRQVSYSISMKHFKLNDISNCEWLAIVLPILLIAPNIGLDITEQMSAAGKIVNLILPLSFYAFLMSSWRRCPITALLCVPFMILAGFQIVLLYLYGGAIIGVDMFLNVVTTSVEEVNELLGNLMIAIGVVVILYVPAIVYSIAATIRKREMSQSFKKCYFKISSISLAISTSLMILTAVFDRSYSVSADLFPANVIENLYRAFERYGEVENYHETSARFAYNADSERDRDLREIYVAVIGETSRAENWQLCGYSRETNPKLSQIERLTTFDRALSQSNTTHKSVPLMMTPLTAENFDSINNIKSIITAFNEAGFHTSFFSSQRRNRSYTEFFSNEADTTVYLPDDPDSDMSDRRLMELLGAALADTIHKKQFIVLHTYGSHFNYRDRYPAEFSYFKPDSFTDANPGNRDKLINAFDNTIRYIDSYLSEAIAMLDSADCVSALFYAPDHGEDIYDDDRNRFLHASPTPTYHQLYVPMIVWISKELDRQEPQISDAINSNRHKFMSPSVSLFHTILDVSGIITPMYNDSLSTASPNFRSPEALYLTDRNQSVDILSSGLKKQDIDLFNKKSFLKTNQ